MAKTSVQLRLLLEATEASRSRRQEMILNNRKMSLPVWHRWLVSVALAAGVIIYGRGTFDFSRLGKIVVFPAWLFFCWSLWLVLLNLRAGSGHPQAPVRLSSWARTALGLVIGSASWR